MADMNVNVQAVLTDISTDQSHYARHSDLFAFRHQSQTNVVVPHSTGENIVVEFRYVVVVVVVFTSFFSFSSFSSFITSHHHPRRRCRSSSSSTAVVVDGGCLSSLSTTAVVVVGRRHRRRPSSSTVVVGRRYRRRLSSLSVVVDGRRRRRWLSVVVIDDSRRRCRSSLSTTAVVVVGRRHRRRPSSSTVVVGRRHRRRPSSLSVVVIVDGRCRRRPRSSMVVDNGRRRRRTVFALLALRRQLGQYCSTDAMSAFKGLVWLIGAMMCLLGAPFVQLSVSAGSGWPHNALWHHWLMPISCHFLDCKALLVTSLNRVSGAITSVQTFTFTFSKCSPVLQMLQSGGSPLPKPPGQGRAV